MGSSSNFPFSLPVLFAHATSTVHTQTASTRTKDDKKRYMAHRPKCQSFH